MKGLQNWLCGVQFVQEAFLEYCKGTILFYFFLAWNSHFCAFIDGYILRTTAIWCPRQDTFRLGVLGCLVHDHLQRFLHCSWALNARGVFLIIGTDVQSCLTLAGRSVDWQLFAGRKSFPSRRLPPLSLLLKDALWTPTFHCPSHVRIKMENWIIHCCLVWQPCRFDVLIGKYSWVTLDLTLLDCKSLRHTQRIGSIYVSNMVTIYPHWCNPFENLIYLY